ncbi:MAG: glycosyltransferase family 39 protein [Blastocatellia bacterium]
MSRKNSSRKRRTQPRPDSTGGHISTIPRNWIIWLILGVTFLAFSNSVFNGFAYDDTTQILKNEFIRDIRNLPKALVTETWYWRVQQDQDPTKQEKPTTPYYRPVFIIYLMMMWKLFGTSAPGWHLFNIILHLLTTYFVFLMLERITKERRLPAIASLLFAVHPLRSESVAWVSGLTDPLLAIFCVASFYLYIRYREEGKVKLLIGSLVLFTLAAFSKEPAVALPIFIAAYELLIVNQDKGLRDRIMPAIKYSASFLVVSAAYFVARYYALGFALNNSGFKSYPIHQVVLTIPLVIWKYIGLLLWPFELTLFHGTPMVKSPLDLRFILPFAGLMALGAALWQLRNFSMARFAILWFFINLLPVLNLSAFGEDFLVQERYVYIPSIGFSLLVAMGLSRIPLERWLSIRNRRAAQAVLVSVLVFVLAGKSLAQNTTWKDDMTVWYHGVETAPEQSMPHYVLGHKLIDLGEYGKAAEQLEEYLKLSPNNLIVISNLASAYVLIYQYQAAVSPGLADRAPLDRALELCEKGLAVNSSNPPLWDTLGSVHTFDTGLKNYDRAIACFERGLSLDPSNAMINFHMGGTFVKKGNPDLGMRFLKVALELQPELVDAHKFLAYAYKGKGQIKEAIAELSIYLQLQPNAPDAPKVSRDVQELRAQLQPASPQS